MIAPEERYLGGGRPIDGQQEACHRVGGAHLYILPTHEAQYTLTNKRRRGTWFPSTLGGACWHLTSFASCYVLVLSQPSLFLLSE